MSAKKNKSSVKEQAKAAVKAQRKTRREAGKSERVYYYVLGVTLADGTPATWRFRYPVDMRTLSSNEQMELIVGFAERFGVRDQIEKSDTPNIVCACFEDEETCKELYLALRGANAVPVNPLGSASILSSHGGAA